MSRVDTALAYSDGDLGAVVVSTCLVKSDASRAQRMAALGRLVRAASREEQEALLGAAPKAKRKNLAPDGAGRDGR